MPDAANWPPGSPDQPALSTHEKAPDLMSGALMMDRVFGDQYHQRFWARTGLARAITPAFWQVQ